MSKTSTDTTATQRACQGCSLGPRHGRGLFKAVLVQEDRAVGPRRHDVYVAVAIEIGGHEPFRLVGRIESIVRLEPQSEADGDTRWLRIPRENAVRFVGVEHIQLIITVEVGHVDVHSLNFDMVPRPSSSSNLSWYAASIV